MTQVDQLDRAALPELEPIFAAVEAGMGFVPNSFLTMAHWPELVQTFTPLAATVLNGGVVDSGLKQLLAHVASSAAGCRYCQAHTAHNATRRGVSAEKVAAAFEFERSTLFSAAERAALRVAAKGGTQPNAIEAADMTALAEHFEPRAIVEIVAVIALFGFLNRWNDSLATTLEDHPTAFATEHLAGSGWTAGKHGT